MKVIDVNRPIARGSSRSAGVQPARPCSMPMNLRVGRATPCAPLPGSGQTARRGLPRPTANPCMAQPRVFGIVEPSMNLSRGGDSLSPQSILEDPGTSCPRPDLSVVHGLGARCFRSWNLFMNRRPIGLRSMRGRKSSARSWSAAALCRFLGTPPKAPEGRRTPRRWRDAVRAMQVQGTGSRPIFGGFPCP
jgi:hypothetical protein